MILKINSNDGWQVVEFIRLKKVEVNPNTFYLFRLQINSYSWNREDLLRGEVTNLVKDKSIKFEQLTIERSKWNDFLKNIINWESKGQLFLCEFYNEAQELFSIKLTDSDRGLISSIEKPVLCIAIEDSRSKFEFKMIIDRTSFSEELLEN